jgi:hypothetical protein
MISAPFLSLKNIDTTKVLSTLVGCTSKEYGIYTNL